MADQVHRWKTQRAQKAREIAHKAMDGHVLAGLKGCIRIIAPTTQRDCAVAGSKDRDLIFPGPKVSGPAMNEYHRRAVTGVYVCQGRSIDVKVGHYKHAVSMFRLLPHGAGAKQVRREAISPGTLARVGKALSYCEHLWKFGAGEQPGRVKETA
jgi:hypothetical protein